MADATAKKPDNAAKKTPEVKAKPAPKPAPPKGPKPLATLQSPRQVDVLRFSPCYKFLIASGYSPLIHRWDASQDTFPELSTLTVEQGWVTGLAITAENERLFAGSSWGRLVCWPYQGEKPAPVWTVADAHDGWIRSVAASPDGKTIATCGVDGHVKLWSAADGKKLQSWSEHGTDGYCVAFAPDGKSLLSGDIQGTIRQWDLASGKLLRQLDASILHLATDDTLQDVGGVRCLAFDAEGKTLVATGSKPAGGGFVQATPTLVAFDWASGKAIETRTFGADKDGFIHDLVFHPDGYWIGVTSGQPGNGQFFFWRIGEEKPFFSYTKVANCHSVALHNDHVRFAISATNGDSAGNGRRMRSDDDYKGNASPVTIWDITQLKT